MKFSINLVVPEHNNNNSIGEQFNTKTPKLDKNSHILLGSETYEGMAALFIGQMPVLLNPALMLEGAMAFSQAMLDTEKNSDLVMPLPQVA